jgi:hypothetical protein
VKAHLEKRLAQALPFSLVVGREKEPISEETARMLHDLCGFKRVGECFDTCRTSEGNALAHVGIDLSKLSLLLRHPANPLEIGSRAERLLSVLATEKRR